MDKSKTSLQVRRVRVIATMALTCKTKSMMGKKTPSKTKIKIVSSKVKPPIMVSLIRTYLNLRSRENSSSMNSLRMRR